MLIGEIKIMGQFKNKTNTTPIRHYKWERILLYDIVSFFLNAIKLFLSAPIIIVMVILISIHELKIKLKKTSNNENGISSWMRIDRIMEKYGLTDLIFYVAAIGYLFFFWFIFDVVCHNSRRKIGEYYDVLYDYAG